MLVAPRIDRRSSSSRVHTTAHAAHAIAAAASVRLRIDAGPMADSKVNDLDSSTEPPIPRTGVFKIMKKSSRKNAVRALLITSIVAAAIAMTVQPALGHNTQITLGNNTGWADHGNHANGQDRECDGWDLYVQAWNAAGASWQRYDPDGCSGFGGTGFAHLDGVNLTHYRICEEYHTPTIWRIVCSPKTAM